MISEYQHFEGALRALAMKRGFEMAFYKSFPASDKIFRCVYTVWT
jgi:hypothetical protein